MNLGHIRALVLRYTFLYTRSVPRVAEMFFWPVMDLLVWGFLTVYLQQLGHQVPAMITFLLGSMIFWDILYRAQQAVTISFLEDIWARNLLNIFVSPIRVSEFIAATYVVGFVKILITVAILATVATSFSGSYTYTGFRKWNMGAGGSYSVGKSIGTSLGRYGTMGGTFSVTRPLTRFTQAVMSFSTTKYESAGVAYYNRLMYQVRIGLGFSPSGISLGSR